MKWKGKFENFDQKKKYKLLHWKKKKGMTVMNQKE
jgi:hypothetical protein